MTSEKYTASEIFDCKQCGDCCMGYGGTYVTENDVVAISDFIGCPKDEFVGKYCNLSGGHAQRMMAQLSNGFASRNKFETKTSWRSNR